MRGKLITPIILLIALLFTSIINIVYKVNHLESMIRMCIVLVLFFIIGKIAERIIVKAIEKEVPVIEDEVEEDYMVDLKDDETSME